MFVPWLLMKLVNSGIFLQYMYIYLFLEYFEMLYVCINSVLCIIYYLRINPVYTLYLGCGRNIKKIQKTYSVAHVEYLLWRTEFCGARDLMRHRNLISVTHGV